MGAYEFHTEMINALPAGELSEKIYISPTITTGPVSIICPELNDYSVQHLSLPTLRSVPGNFWQPAFVVIRKNNHKAPFS
jgi:hypothetical protein